MHQIQDEIEQRLVKLDPKIEVLLAEVVGGQLLRLYIDHPDGVTLDLCERVSRELSDTTERYALEVSSPGSQRPLTKPEHYKRYLGKRAKIRARSDSKLARTQNRQTFTGEIFSATDEEITVAAEDGVFTIALTDIRRSNLIGD